MQNRGPFNAFVSSFMREWNGERILLRILCLRENGINTDYSIDRDRV